MKYILSTTTTAILKRTIIARFHPPTSRFCFFSTQSLLYRNDPKAIHDDYSYCINLVKERDGEGYLCGLLMPSKIQKSYYAIRALNVEIASIKDGYNIRSKRQSTISFGGGNEGEENDILSSPASLALQMRIEWWKNAINKIYTTAPLNSNDDAKHTNIQKQEQEDNVGKDTDYLTIATSCWTSPVVRCLHRSLYDDNDNTKDFKWTKRFMERLIDAREIDLNVIQYNTLDELVNYSSETVSSVLYLTLESAGVPEDTNLDVVTDHAGIGIGLVTALRSTPFRLVFGEVPIPNELFPKSYPYGRLVEEVFKQQQNHGDDDDDDGDTTALLSEQDTKQLQEAVRYVADVAAQHFTYTRTYQSYIPSNCKSCVLLPMIPSLHYLSNLQDAKYNILDPALMDPHSKRLKLLLLLSRTWLTGIF